MNKKHNQITQTIYNRTQPKKNLHEIKRKTTKNKKSNIKIDENFRKLKFIKYWQKDIYIYPKRFILTKINNNMQNDIEYNVYGTDACFTCPNQAKCATEFKRKIKDR